MYIASMQTYIVLWGEGLPTLLQLLGFVQWPTATPAISARPPHANTQPPIHKHTHTNTHTHPQTHPQTYTHAYTQTHVYLKAMNLPGTSQFKSPFWMFSKVSYSSMLNEA